MSGPDIIKSLWTRPAASCVALSTGPASHAQPWARTRDCSKPATACDRRRALRKSLRYPLRKSSPALRKQPWTALQKPRPLRKPSAADHASVINPCPPPRECAATAPGRPHFHDLHHRPQTRRQGPSHSHQQRRLHLHNQNTPALRRTPLATSRCPILRNHLRNLILRLNRRGAAQHQPQPASPS
jgi:hypothetical protein